MFRLVIVTGTPGSGKTTVLKKALEKVKKYNVVNFGTVMFEIGRKEGIIDNRDEIRKLSTEKEKDLQRRTGKEIGKMREKEDIIIDSHCTIRTPEGYLIGFPSYVLEEIRPDAFVLIEAKPEEIRLRREADKSRKRDIESIEELDEHQKKNREVAEEYKKISGAEIVIIENPQNRLQEAVDRLIKVLE